MPDCKNLKIHFLYVVFILVGLLILVATDKWSLSPKFTEFLANAATMTSLFLGIIAIFYSIVSNGDLSKNLGSITKVSEDVSQAKLAMALVVEKSEQLNILSQANAGDLKDISNGMNASISDMRAAMLEFQTQTGAIRESVGLLPSRFDALEVKLTESASTVSPAPNLQTPDAIAAEDSLAEKVFKGLSLAAGFAIYGVVLAARDDIELDLDEYQKALKISSPAYFHGALVAVAAVGLITLTPVKGVARKVKINYINEKFAQLETDSMVSWVAEKSKRQNITNPERWTLRVKLADEFFAI